MTNDMRPGTKSRLLGLIRGFKNIKFTVFRPSVTYGFLFLNYGCTDDPRSPGICARHIVGG